MADLDVTLAGAPAGASAHAGESAHAGDETAYEYSSGPQVAHGRLATWLFLAGETLFFAGLISAWFVLRSQTSADVWAASGRPHLVTGLAMTGLLLAASIMGHSTIKIAKASRHMELAARLGLTGLLVLSFLCLQVIEYGQLDSHGTSPSTSVRWGAFYALTLCHGLHVLIGFIWVCWLFFRAVGAGLEGDKSGPLEYGVLYLHFVDAVWLLLLVLLYVIP